MDFKDAMIYLKLCEELNITKTARALGVTQSAVTQRLQNLEREFGMQLVLRERGQKYVELTESGARLLPIIQQWAELYEAAGAIKDKNARTRMTISCTNSIGAYLLPRFLLDYARGHGEILLSVLSNHSWEILDLLEEGAIDIGLTNREHPPLHDRFQITPFYREPYVYVTSSDNMDADVNAVISVSDLPVEKELFFDITPAFTQWRRNIWEGRHPFMQTSFVQLMPDMMAGTDYWSILPMSIARSFAELYPISYRRLDSEPAPRVCSLVTCKRNSTWKAEEKEEFTSSLVEYFARTQEKCATAYGS